MSVASNLFVEGAPPFTQAVQVAWPIHTKRVDPHWPAERTTARRTPQRSALLQSLPPPDKPIADRDDDRAC